MKIELRVTQPNTGKILKALGVKIKADYYWRYLNVKKKWELNTNNCFYQDTIPAFDLAMLGQMIPWGFLQKTVIHKMPGGFWQCELSDKKMHSFPTETEARAFYLIDLIKSGQVTAMEVNSMWSNDVRMPVKNPVIK